MALMDDTGDNKDFINALTYLGKGPYNIGMPGGSDIAVGAGPAPAPGVNVGSFGTLMGGGPAESGAVGKGGTGGGADILGILQNFLKAGGKTADFASKLGGGQPQGLDVLKDMAGGGEIGLGTDTALQGLGTELPNTALGTTPDMSGLLKELQGTLGSSSLQDPTLGLGSSGSAFDAGAGAGGGLAGDIGAGASGAGALSAILGALASATGNSDLAKAGEALGAAGSAAGLAGTGASLASTGGTLAAEGAAGAGLGAGAGAAAAPIAAMLLATSIANMISPDSAPGFQDILNTPGIMGNYPFFGPKLAGTLGTENKDINALASALPYATSQKELQDLINTFTGSVANQGGVGGYGEGAAPFTVPNLPGAGGSAHEGGQTADFGGEVNLLNSLIGNLKGGLPETGGGDAGQLWNQMFAQTSQGAPSSAPGGANTSLTVKMPDGSTQIMDPYQYYSWYNNAQMTGQNPGDYFGNVIQFGQPGFDYAGAGLVPPGNAPGAPSNAWTQMIAQLTGGPTAGAGSVAGAPIGGAPAPGVAGAAGPGTPLPDVYQDLLKQLQGAA